MTKLQGLLGLAWAWDCKMGVQSISGGSHGPVVDPYTTQLVTLNVLFSTRESEITN